MKRISGFTVGCSVLAFAVFVFSASLFAKEQAAVSSEIPAGGSDPAVSETISVPRSEWEKMQADLEAVKKQMAEDQEKTRLKKEADDLKKYQTPSVKLGGVLLWDAAGSSLDDEMEYATGSGDVSGCKPRQIWLDLSGSMYEMIQYRVTFDASNSTVKDAWIGLVNTPSGVDFKVGHMKEPWSSDELTTFQCCPLMEKSYLNSMRGICGSRNNGILFSNWSQADRFTWAAGLFASSMPEDDLSCIGEHGHMAFTSRMTYLPYYEENAQGQRFFTHLGASYSYRSYDQEKAADYSTRCNFMSNSQITPNVLQTGILDGLESMNVFCLELYWMRGPLSIDFEHGFFFMEDDRAGSALVQTGYVMAAYTLTGESRNYRKAGGSYGRLKPNEPFIRTCRDGVGVFSGPGAWEIAYMCTWADTTELADGYAAADFHPGLYGKSLMNVWGLNWYLNQNCRLMFNYALVHGDYEGFNKRGENVDGIDGLMHVYGMRFQITF